jgi:hypothetical protein
MTHWRKAFPSKFLQSSDLEQPLIVTVTRIVNENVGAGDAVELKPVAHFAETEKGVVLNLTRAEALAGIAGDEDMDAWPGTRLLLRRGTTRYQGKKVSCIEIAPAPRSRPVAAAPAAATMTPIALGEPFEEPTDNDGF